MIKGFKEFVLRGNVIDLAVAVVIATAFAGLIGAVTTNVINPIIASLGSVDAGGLGFQITDAPATFVNFGAVITAVINFLILAAVVYSIIVVPMNRLLALRKKGVEPEPEAPHEDVLLLQEIRDLLRAQQASTQPPSTARTTNPDS